MAATHENTASESQDLLTAFRNAVDDRSKALKRNHPSLDLRDSSDGPSVVLELAAETSRTTRVTVRVWADGGLWIDARRHNKNGWLWQHTYKAFLDEKSGAVELLAKIEQFASLVPPGPNVEPVRSELEHALFADRVLLRVENEE